jgi:putative ABC transport system permease protein
MQDRLFRMLLVLLPREFRGAYAREIETTFRSERRDAGSRGHLARLWMATVFDVVRVAPSHHWEILARDVRVAWRAMTRQPLHAATAIVTLALGLGASVGMFAVIDAVWLRALPYRAPAELVFVGETANGGRPGPIGYPTFVDLRAATQTMAGLAAATQSTATLTGDGNDPERVSVMRASSNYLEMIGVAPAIGRWLAESEDRPGEARRVIVLSDELWRRRFRAHPAVVNRVIKVNALDYRVVGVMPAGFKDLVAGRLYDNAAMWTPLGYDPAASYACRTCRHLRVFGRLAPGRSAAAAERELAAILARSAAANPSEYHRPGIGVVSLNTMFFGPVRPTLIVLSIGVVLLLCVACGNVANLLLLRATERAHEVAVRTALGVTTARLIRQHVTEATLLSVLAALLGIPLAYAVVQIFVAAGAASMPRLETAALDARAVLAAVAVVILSGVVFGVMAATHLRRLPFGSTMGGAGRRTAGGPTWRARSWLIGANMAMAAVLLIGSGLLVRSLLALLAVNTGFDARDVLTLRLSLGGPRFSGSTDEVIPPTLEFYDTALDRIRRLPGVQSAAAVTTLPLGGNVDGYGLHVVGRPLANPQSAPSADRFVVTPDYFELMRMPLIRGRLLGREDRRGGAAVAVVNATLAEEIFPGEDAIGRQIALGPPDAPPRTIVGIVGDVRHRGVDAPITYQAYVPQAQWVWAETDMTILVRTAGRPLAMAASVRQVLREIDPAQPVGAVRDYPEVVASALATRRVAAQLLTLFAAVAFVLAAVGLYGALGVVARQRQHEIGVRMALGARASEVARLVMTQGLRPAILGLLAGIIVAAASANGVAALLFGVSGLDPGTFVAAATALIAAAIIASAVPAWRAARTSAVIALRAD